MGRDALLVSRRRFHKTGTLCGASLLVLLCLISPVFAAENAIPRRAWVHKSVLIRSARALWGLEAPTATFAAQVHAESGWRADAVSPAGAQGMAQFMPATARWMTERFPHLSGGAPFNPSWALRALVTYDLYLWNRVAATDSCNRMAKALAAYNGGLGWVRRDEALARRRGLDAGVWFGGVETVNAGRRASAKRENRAYPPTILLHLEPLYIRAGFGRGICHE